jgi:hypothetical protein
MEAAIKIQEGDAMGQQITAVMVEHGVPGGTADLVAHPRAAAEVLVSLKEIGRAWNIPC